MNWWEWITLISAVGGFYFAGAQWWQNRRYTDFLKRVHLEAADVEDGPREYVASAYPVTVPEDDLDLAFRALADEILMLDQSGWACRPARFVRPPPPR